MQRTIIINASDIFHMIGAIKVILMNSVSVKLKYYLRDGTLNPIKTNTDDE